MPDGGPVTPGDGLERPLSSAAAPDPGEDLNLLFHGCLGDLRPAFTALLKEWNLLICLIGPDGSQTSDLACGVFLSPGHPRSPSARQSKITQQLWSRLDIPAADPHV